MVGSTSEFSVRRVDWNSTGNTLRVIRKHVFVDEQRVPEDLEWDGLDGGCVHVLAIAGSGAAIGCGRLLPDGHIGRMAVLKPWRGKGVGAALLAELIIIARERGHVSVELSAQTHALGFYRRFGFRVTGAEYPEAGIPHCAMRLALRD